jgi:hypothetical protein
MELLASSFNASLDGAPRARKGGSTASLRDPSTQRNHHRASAPREPRMRKYRSNASSTVRFEYGLELVAGLSSFPETAAAAIDFDTVNEALAAEHAKRLALRAPLLRARAKLRFVDHRVDQVIRSAARAAEIVDGGRRGRVAGAIFPEGVRPVVALPGRRQVKPTRDLVDRLENARIAGIDDYRTAWLPKLKAALGEIEGAVYSYDAALAAHDAAFKAEVALREAHHDAVDRIVGLVRAAFPRNRAVQDVIFPPIQESDAQETATELPPAAEPARTAALLA